MSGVCREGTSAAARSAKLICDVPFRHTLPLSLVHRCPELIFWCLLIQNLRCLVPAYALKSSANGSGSSGFGSSGSIGSCTSASSSLKPSCQPCSCWVRKPFWLSDHNPHLGVLKYGPPPFATIIFHIQISLKWDFDRKF